MLRLGVQDDAGSREHRLRWCLQATNNNTLNVVDGDDDSDEQQRKAEAGTSGKLNTQ